MEYFKNCECIEELKKQYRSLCFKYHPDINKSPEAVQIMQIINNEYDALFEKLKNVFKNQKGEIYTDKKPVSEAPEDFRNIISELIKLEDLTIELMGRWIWAYGDTKPHKETLKKLNFRWCSKKKAWSWHRPEDATVSKGKYTLNDIREKYGSTTYQKTKDQNTNTGKIETKAS